MGDERVSRAKVVTELQVEVEDGSSRVAQLEGNLRQCQAEVEGHVTRIERQAAQHKEEMRQAKRQVRETVEIHDGREECWGRRTRRVGWRQRDGCKEEGQVMAGGMEKE